MAAALRGMLLDPPSPSGYGTRKGRFPTQRVTGRMQCMSKEEIEVEALKLDPKARARLAEKLLESLESLSEEENERLWAEEAQRRDAEADADRDALRPTAEVLGEARTTR